MAIDLSPPDINRFLDLIPTVRNAPSGEVSLSYDAEADVLYVNFESAARATDSELTDDDVIIRYRDRGKTIVGLTILHAATRQRRVG